MIFKYLDIVELDGKLLRLFNFVGRLFIEIVRLSNIICMKMLDIIIFKVKWFNNFFVI